MSWTFSNFKKHPYAVGRFIFCIVFFTSALSRPNLFSITGIKVMISGIDFDGPDHLTESSESFSMIASKFTRLP